jgi:DNA-damage-inducible protein J
MTNPIRARKALPFDPLVPNADTIEAMRAARRGDLVRSAPLPLCPRA